MHPYAPFHGGLVLAERLPGTAAYPVQLGDGRLVGYVRTETKLFTRNFHVVDPSQRIQLGYGSRYDTRGWGYRTVTARNELLVGLEMPVFRGPRGQSRVHLPGGRVLYTNHLGSLRTFELVDALGAVQGRLDGWAWHLYAPVLSIAQAAALAQSLKQAVQAQRRSTYS
ncbi:hypothetical protein ABZS66_56560 [Dactylosporangium sp. NPDC005572]|uniref:hypothetical protein n=1 Tax=Dactylosporangium sp. NPDC005572 TaxID=3156889 RepID=UPI0033A24F9C